MKLNICSIFAIISLLFFSCERNPYHKPVSDIAVTIEKYSFHTEMYDLGMNPSQEKYEAMRQKYGEFFSLYLQDIRRTMMIADTVSDIAVARLFAHDEWMAELYRLGDSVLQKHDTQLKKKIENAFQYYKYYFPENDLPKIYTIITGVNYSMLIDSGCVAIGVDKYLGQNCSFYNSVNMESYIRRNLNPEKIPADLMRAVAEGDFSDAFEEDYLLANMIQCGRYQYFMKCMLPDEPDTLLWGFTEKQLQFCEKSEGEFWKFFIGTENLLFSTDRMVQKRFLDDGPFTVVFTKDSPARIGQWIGYKIVESYMKNNPQVSLKDLFSIRSSKEIMSKAKYNPK